MAIVGQDNAKSLILLDMFRSGSLLPRTYLASGAEPRFFGLFDTMLETMGC